MYIMDFRVQYCITDCIGSITFMRPLQNFPLSSPAHTSPLP
jgi:hypothetical protein